MGLFKRSSDNWRCDRGNSLHHYRKKNAFQGNNKTIYNEEKRHYLVHVVKAGIWGAAAAVLIGCTVHFLKLPIFPDARERQRLVHEMKSIQSEMLKDEISENLYSRVVKYNEDNKKYGVQHRGCEVDVTFDTDVFNSFDSYGNSYKGYVYTVCYEPCYSFSNRTCNLKNHVREVRADFCGIAFAMKYFKDRDFIIKSKFKYRTNIDDKADLKEMITVFPQICT